MNEAITAVRPPALTLAAAVDRACERFEAAWGFEPRPRIEEFLGGVDEPGYSLLLRELLASELRRRVGLGEPADAAAYRERFPGHTGLVEEIFASVRGETSTARTADTAAGRPGAAPPRFRIVRSHAEGGLGVVFVARDRELPREVALKEIQGAMADDPGCRARFVREAEITGALEHPGIVPVYGLGAYPDGRPYYAMRFIRGESFHQGIAEFHGAESPGRDPGERALALRKLLRRFVDVCNTVAYAHSRGVLHRDLKPANVMLGPYGETLVVDWGLTRVSGGPAGSAVDPPPLSAVGAGLTRSGFAMGTPSYMSPEQAAGRLDDLAPATDVYSLGATLYCLLAGRPAIDAGDLDAALRCVQYGDFPPPREVNPRVDRALEAVCLKAMARSPEERYGSALALADEVEHWLADEPVAAWREPLVRRARRWARRHRTAVTAAVAALAVALAASVAIAGLQSLAAKRERDLKVKERDAKTLALARLGQVEKANELLGSIFKDLDPQEEEKEGRPLRAILGERLRRAAGSLEGESIGDPLTVARMQAILGSSQLGLGNTAESIALLSRCCRTREALLGSNDPETLYGRIQLAMAYQAAGRTSEAIRLLETTLKAEESTLGPDDFQTLTTRNNLATAYQSAGRTSEAIGLLAVTLKAEELTLGPDDPQTLTCRHNLAAAYQAAGRTAEAIALFEATLKSSESRRGPFHTDTILSRNALASAYLEAGRTDEAIGLHLAALKAQEAKLGPSHPQTLLLRNDLALAYAWAGRLDDALRLHEWTLKELESTLGPEHPETLTGRHNVASTYELLGRTADAIRLHEATLKARESALGPVHPSTLASRNALAQAYQSAGRTDESIAMQKGTLKARESALGPDHPDTLVSRDNLALTYVFAGRPLEAVAMHEAALKARVSQMGPDHPNTLVNRNNLGMAYYAAGRIDDAIAIHESTLKAMETKLGRDHAHTMRCRLNLAVDYAAAGRTDEAIALYKSALSVMVPKLGDRHRDVLLARGGLAVSYNRAGRPAEAIPLLESTVEAQRSLLGPEHPTTLTNLDNLAGAYRDIENRLPDAIALYEKVLKARRATIGPGHPDTLKTTNNLAMIYLNEGRTGEAVAMLEPALRAAEANLGPDHPETLVNRNNLGMAYYYAGRPAAAITLLEPTFRTRRSKLPPDHSDVVISRSNLAAAYEAAGRYADQEPLAREGLAQARRQFGAADQRSTGAMAWLGFCLVRQAKWAEAEAVLRECLPLREAGEPGSWTVFNTRSMLGEALSGQGRYEVAEPLLVSGYEGLKALEAAIPASHRTSRLTEAALRVASLYESWGKPAAATEWKSRLGLSDLPADVFAPNPPAPTPRR